MYNEFFNIVLPQSSYYRRFGGFFSAKRFALIAEGLQEFIKENNGNMELVIIPTFSQDDKDAIMQGIDVSDIITKNWIENLSQIKEKFLQDHKMALSWMIANNYLSIKLILPEHDDGTLFSESELKDHAIFRKEIGIFYDKDDDHIPLSFHGTIDREDSEVGELYSLDISRSWVDSEKERVASDHEEFVNFWDNDTCQIGSIKCKIIPISKKLEEYFEKISPKTKSDIPNLKKYPVLRKYQNMAIDSWRNNAGRGIFEMATGTGKTFAAIGCIKRIELEEDRILVVIAVPYRNLVDQWKKELNKWDLKSIILESGTWRHELADEVSHLNKFDGKEFSIIITTHDLFAKDDFVKQIKKCEIPTILIVDEAHHAGAFATRDGLSDNYQYRLALSATIDRYFDQDGTDFLREYFKGSNDESTVATYSLKKAIEDGKLCGYNYYPYFIELNEDEFVKYRELTYKAAKLLNSKDIDDRKRGELIIQLRAKIVRDATNKSDALKKILDSISEIKHMLIFCSENQFDYIERILDNPSKHGINKQSVLSRRITYDSPKSFKDRTKILNDFANEDWDVLLSNRVLDEGMDVPQARNCIILASTGNPTQFIQRRGRVLRTYHEPYKDGSKKIHADIYDILVKPQINKFENADSIKLEIGMIRSQLSRIKYMGELALNKTYCADEIKKFTSGIPTDLLDS